MLEPLAARYGLNIQTALGEISMTRCRELVERADARSIRILYVSDFDPGGLSMPVAAAVKIGWLNEGGVDIRLQFGEGATELDALEALRPGELRRILVREIERFRDPHFAGYRTRPSTTRS